MSKPPIVSALVGFDATIFGSLPSATRNRLAQLSWALLGPCALIGSSAALGAWQLERSLPAAIVLGIATGIGILNLLRVVIAGGGAAPHFSRERVQSWAPKLTPLVLLGAIAACFAQPVYLELTRGRLDTKIATHRAQLIAQHHRSVANLGLGAVADQSPAGGRAGVKFEPASFDSYEQRVMSCDFVTRRLALVWHRPDVPSLFTALYCLLALSPLLLSHSTHLRALRAYELKRWENARAVVRDDERRTQHGVGRELAGWLQLSPEAAAEIRTTSGALPPDAAQPDRTDQRFEPSGGAES
jgi:hypothetical protein